MWKIDPKIVLATDRELGQTNLISILKWAFDPKYQGHIGQIYKNENADDSLNMGNRLLICIDNK